ncbi:hypothetical protein [Pedobacter sp. MW01-1-1]|uniref:hypothetical protein n=1 Tax=Pedobacter sp. MW01-1-1 TaxID=3383027 RepID=UPI003FF0C20B
MANPVNFQSPIQSIITKLAWLYRLDYSISDGREIFSDLPNDNPCDLIYLKATRHTSISAKDFQQLVNQMFSQAALFGCVDIFFQLQKSLKDYPFPSDFVRPLNYPYLEIYENSQKKLYIDPQALEDLDLNSNNTMVN